MCIDREAAEEMFHKDTFEKNYEEKIRENNFHRSSRSTQQKSTRGTPEINS